jgi:hypothetical protein
MPSLGAFSLGGEHTTPSTGIPASFANEKTPED